MKVGYYWLAKSGEPISQHSPEVVKFFKELIENDMIEFPPQKTRKMVRISSSHLSIKEYLIKQNLFKHLELSDVSPFLKDNTIIKGFKISEKPYTYIHQNLFQSKYKLTKEISEFSDSLFLLDYTGDIKDKLYLCSERSFSPSKFRFVLKSEETNNSEFDCFLIYNYGYDDGSGNMCYKYFEEQLAERGGSSFEIEKLLKEKKEPFKPSANFRPRSKYHNGSDYDPYADTDDPYADTDLGDPRGWW